MPRRVVLPQVDGKGSLPAPPPPPVPEQVLGSLEARVLQVLWAHDKLLSLGK